MPNGVALARRFELPLWQFTLSARQANTEAIRVTRAITGRDTVLMFDGKYHGQADELLGELDAGRVVPEGLGVPVASVAASSRLTLSGKSEAIVGAFAS